MSTLTQIDSFSDLSILVIGDVMVDAYYFGLVDRISPEAPVPIISVTKKDHRPGGAANVALNIISLGAKVKLGAVIGDDDEGKELMELLRTDGVNIEGVAIDISRPTTMKTRVISGNTHLLRIDHESTGFITSEIEEKLINFVQKNINTTDAIILEDYNKGLLSERLISEVIEIANKNKVPTIVDPKKENFFAYRNCTLFKPNRKEIKEGLKTDLDLSKLENIEKATGKLIEILDCESVMVTLSEDGVYLKKNNQASHIKAHKRIITDVSGAGDTVVSVAALCLASGMDLLKAAEIANIAGGIVCEKVGVVPINKEELIEEIKRLNL
jgi:rfaE bifunctional protein kinase chain/domain